ncbi:MAG: aminotransferase class III-fold pyridoxal phosphate-dependent enzyme [Limnobacter sp.]|nr:aminotransferase class III-fold pyridoxal phosphate-dependent enzyme [Limnobacter sp.]
MSKLFALAAFGLMVPKAHHRIALSRAKHRSLAGHSNWSKRIAKLLPYYEFTGDDFFNSDQVSGSVVARRKQSFTALSEHLSALSPKSLQMSAECEKSISDMQFVGRYRVPFPYGSVVRQHLKIPSLIAKAQSIFLTDIDGNSFYDLTGSYGTNLLGHDFYQQCLKKAHEQAADNPTVLGSYHPQILDNVEQLRRISDKQEVSFHMSGTEAVMQAVRLARYHSRKRYLVRFCGAYHGWWGDVQPGLGNPSKARDTLTLADLSARTLSVLASRNDIACVLVNPLQALHPNKNASSDSSLLLQRSLPAYDRRAYREWLQKLRVVCDKKNIALIFDEVFVGFRLAYGGAQEYFGVKADMVTYGKTLGGGLPVGVLCGNHQWMRRYNPRKPANVCFARGTFNSHPMVMTAMGEFLRKARASEVQYEYSIAEQKWQTRKDEFNMAFQSAGYPVQFECMQTVWTIGYTSMSRYHWMYQFFLRKHGLALSWVGTGRLIFSFNYSDAQVRQVLARFLAAARDMQEGGWWECGFENAKAARKQLVKESFKAFWQRLTR